VRSNLPSTVPPPRNLASKNKTNLKLKWLSVADTKRVTNFTYTFNLKRDLSKLKQMVKIYIETVSLEK